jgi:hypothetical protein
MASSVKQVTYAHMLKLLTKFFITPPRLQNQMAPEQDSVKEGGGEEGRHSYDKRAGSINT